MQKNLKMCPCKFLHFLMSKGSCQKHLQGGGVPQSWAFGRKVLTPPNFTEKVTYPP